MKFDVVLLSGGMATRMRPITETIPKAMIEIKGKPFIDYQLKLLSSKGINKVVICVGYLSHAIEAYVGNGSQYGMQVDYSYDGETLLGTGGAVKKALNLLNDPFFVLYGDSYLPINFKEIQDYYLHQDKPALMTVYKNSNAFDTSNVIFRNENLLHYSKKTKLIGMDYIDYGLGILRKELFSKYPDNHAFDLAEIYEDLSIQGKLAGFEVTERFFEIGSLQGLEDFNQYITRQHE